MANYTTEAAVKALKIQGAVVDLSAYSDPEILAEIELAEFVIEKYTNSIFYQKTAEVNYLDGTGDRILFIYPAINYPLITATEVLEVDELDQTLWTYETPDDFFTEDWTLTKNWQDRQSGRRNASRSGGVNWPKGVRNIKVTGDWGRATTPAAITRATILLALESLYAGSTKMASSAGIREKEWEDYRIQYGRNASDVSPVDTTGLDYVDRLLDSYRVNPGLFLVPQSHTPH